MIRAGQGLIISTALSASPWHCPNFNAKEAWKLPIYHIPSSILVRRVIKL